MSMYAPSHGVVDHSSMGSSQRQPSRGFTASYGWASGNPHHVPRFHMSEYQRTVPRVDQKYGENSVVRAPYANDASQNDAPVHNDMPNSVPQFHMSCYERPANIRQSRDGPCPYLPLPVETKDPMIKTSNRSHASPTQTWMSGQDSSLCDNRNDAKAATIISPRNNSKHVGSMLNGFVDPRGEQKPNNSAGMAEVLAPQDDAHVPHASPPQPWQAGYDSSLSKRRNHDSELVSVTLRQTTAAQGMPSPGKAPPATSPTTGGQEPGGGTKKSHSSPMGHQPWAAAWDSSLCRGWEAAPAAKYSSNVAALIHGGE